MDRKLSINPAIKKQHQFIPTERCLSSSSTSIDTPSDLSSSSSILFSFSFPIKHFFIIDNTNDLCSLTTNPILPMMSLPMVSQQNGGFIQHYYNAPNQPYVHFSIPSHPIYCTSVPDPVWHHYFSTRANYPVCIIGKKFF
jgi:hypothetical protein